MNDIHIFLVRHGESQGNLAKDTIGQDPDSPLTYEGEKQAIALYRYFSDAAIKFDWIFSSTYKRAVETAAPTIKHNNLYKLPDDRVVYSDVLVEYNPGSFRGKKRSEIYGNFEQLKAIAYQHMGFKFPDGGESYCEVERRISAFLEDKVIYNKEVLDLAKERDVNVAVFSHGMSIRCFLHHVMGFDQSFLWRINIENASITHVSYNGMGFFLESLNDTSHLK